MVSKIKFEINLLLRLLNLLFLFKYINFVSHRFFFIFFKGLPPYKDLFLQIPLTMLPAAITLPSDPISIQNDCISANPNIVFYNDTTLYFLHVPVEKFSYLKFLYS